MPSYRIMIVEDQREVSRLLRSALESLENAIEVVEIPSGEEAILDSSRNPVDLLVADYRLPGMTGTELMTKVRKYHQKVKVILITGLTDTKIRKHVAEAGADAFFIKPVPIADFLDAVERHLGLVETSLPPEPIHTDDEKEIQRSLPDLLANLRQELEATAVYFLSDSGRVLARAGDLPESGEEASLLSYLLSIHNAGQKISRLIGQKVSSNWTVFDGGKLDLLFAPVGSTHAMLVMGKDLATEEKVMKTVEIFSSARKAIEDKVGQGLPGTPATQEPHTMPREAIKQTTKEMDPLFEEAKKKIKSTDMNEFWDKAAHKHKAPAKPDMLSYEQAKQLGLAPDDKN